jgi:hypothetical protein
MPYTTTEEIANVYSCSSDVIALINSIAAKETITDEELSKLKRSVSHLETIKGYKQADGTTSIWSSEDFSAQDAAVILGKSKYE